MLAAACPDFTPCCAQFAQEASAKVGSMAKNATASDQTRMGMLFAETDDELAYLVFVAPDYPERVAKQLVDKHARAVESMASDGARAWPTLPNHPTRPAPPRACCHAPSDAALCPPALRQVRADVRVPQARSTAGPAQTRAVARRRRTQRCARRWRRSA